VQKQPDSHLSTFETHDRQFGQRRRFVSIHSDWGWCRVVNRSMEVAPRFLAPRGRRLAVPLLLFFISGLGRHLFFFFSFLVISGSGRFS
jgi:hypothetical protein